MQHLEQMSWPYCLCIRHFVWLQCSGYNRALDISSQPVIAKHNNIEPTTSYKLFDITNHVISMWFNKIVVWLSDSLLLVHHIFLVFIHVSHIIQFFLFIRLTYLVDTKNLVMWYSIDVVSTLYNFTKTESFHDVINKDYLYMINFPTALKYYFQTIGTSECLIVCRCDATWHRKESYMVWRIYETRDRD